jgi:6-phosphogluconolactonase (cycloisomerase 2 family)
LPPAIADKKMAQIVARLSNEWQPPFPGQEEFMRTFTALLLVLIAGVSRADTFAYVSLAKDRKIAVYRIEPATGVLMHLADAPCEGEPAALVANPARTSLFASLRPEGKLVAFRIDPRAGTLMHVNTIEAGPDPAHLSTDKDGRFLLAAYYVAGKVAVHAIEEGGSLNPQPVKTVPTAEKAHAILLDRDNRFAFAPHTGPNVIFQFAFNAKTGELTPGSPAKLATPESTGPRHIVFHPQLDVAYVSNEQGGSVTAYRFDNTSGSLSVVQTVSTLPAGFSQRNACAEIKIHPTGKFLYVSNRGHDSIARFQVDGRSGQLTALGHTSTERTPRSFDLDPAGTFLYVCGEATDRLVAYRIDQEAGSLAQTATYSVGKTPWWIAIVDVPR